jgi:hypothetical protein
MKSRYLHLSDLMKPSRFLCGPRLGLLVLPLAFAAVAADSGRTNAPAPKLSYSDFTIVADRNIFNTKRYSKTPGSVARRDTSRAVRGEYFALLGIISYEKGPFAFFDGSSSGSRKSAQVNDEISGFKIKAILPALVRLEAGTNHIELPLGKQCFRPDGGAWQVMDRTEVSYASNERRNDNRSSRDRRDSSANSAGPGTDGEAFDQPTIVVLSGGSDGAGVVSISGDSSQPPGEGAAIRIVAGDTNAPAAGGAENDVLRRLMQRREQELNR